MHDSMLNKLDQLKNRIAEIETLLVDSETVKDIEKYTQLNKEFSELKPIVAKFDEYKKIIKSIDDANEIIKSCLLYTSPSPRDPSISRMPSSA